MKSFAVETSIQASPEQVWALLTDADGYVRWNNTVLKVEGRIAPGQRVTVRPKINPDRAFPVQVVAFEAPRRMVWSGGMPLGLFQGVRTFTLTPGADGAVVFSMREEYSGLLAGLIGRSIPDLQPAFDEFAADLKRAAEAQYV
jgi:uncharacterized protein YndB with AHSA1/START domain